METANPAAQAPTRRNAWLAYGWCCEKWWRRNGFNGRRTNVERTTVGLDGGWSEAVTGRKNLEFKIYGACGGGETDGDFLTHAASTSTEAAIRATMHAKPTQSDTGRSFIAALGRSETLCESISKIGLQALLKFGPVPMGSADPLADIRGCPGMTARSAGRSFLRWRIPISLSSSAEPLADLLPRRGLTQPRPHWARESDPTSDRRK